MDRELYDRSLDASEEHFTMALVADVAEVFVRHGYPPPVGGTPVDLTLGLYRAVHHQARGGVWLVRAFLPLPISLALP